MNLIFADLKELTVNQLMVRMRKQFACSLGLFFLLCIDFAGAVLLTGDRTQHDKMLQMGTLAAMEILVLISFARAWNELRRRTRDEK